MRNLWVIHFCSELYIDALGFEELYDELQHERERSSVFQQQLNGILKDLEEHAEFMSIRVEDIIKIMKELEFEDG